MSITTNSLLNKLVKGKHLDTVLDKYEDDFYDGTISDYLNQLCNERNLVPEHVILKAQIERTYGHQFFNGTRTPSRDKLIQLAFGFGLSLDETQKLLEISGKSILYPKIKRDAICIYAISHQMSVMELQDMLDSNGLPILGT
ncbi:MAG: helix-turn-helix transcriptional regulator [Lachnospiraceae bacterium]|nr:helix-turn-helix transcriptional regulator [Lachnospiraceae bacterium]